MLSVSNRFLKIPFSRAANGQNKHRKASLINRYVPLHVHDIQQIKDDKLPVIHNNKKGTHTTKDSVLLNKHVVLTLVLIPCPTSIPPCAMATVPSVLNMDTNAVNRAPSYATPYFSGTTLIPRFRQRLF